MHTRSRVWPAAVLVVVAAHSVPGCRSTPALPPADQTRCFAGTSEVHLTSGQTFPAGEVIARRTLSPSKGTIVEQVVVPGGPPGTPPREFVVDMTVKGQTLTMTERSGAFTGTGTLSGPAWAWTAWRTESRLPSGARAVSSDTLIGDHLTAEKQIFGPDGKVQVSMIEHYTAVPCSEFERLRTKMLGSRSIEKR